MAGDYESVLNYKNMKVDEFIADFREAFGDKPELPVVFWYSDAPAKPVRKINGCFFKEMWRVRGGETISLSLEVLGCGGGKFYTGFIPMPEHVPAFVSTKERYKQTPQMVIDYVSKLDVPRATKPYLNFSRIDCIKTFDHIEGVLFFATPDILSGLTTWTFFDNNDNDAVQALFGSGCSEIVTRAVLENKQGGRRTFLGLFDPSARPYFEPDILSYVIPMSRFREMCNTIRQSCLFDAHAWNKIRDRINK